MKTIHDLAALLNGRQYRDETTPDIENIAANNNWLIVFGASDDLMEWRGAINDETGAGSSCYEEKFILRCKKGKWEFIDFSEFDEIDSSLLDWIKPVPNLLITPVWSVGESGASWEYITNLPSAPFNIFEDDELYCVGLVIDLNPILA